MKAVSQSLANALESSDDAVAEVESVGQKILEVTAEAVAKISAKVYTPNPGCWAVAYGRAEARAIATAVVEAIAEGLSAAFSPDVAAIVTARAGTKNESIAEAMETVALLLAKGDGSGLHSLEDTATATAKATAINCAMANAFSEVYKNNTANVLAIVRAGCVDFDFGKGRAIAILTPKHELKAPC